jgi:integrase/recombinase XerD
MDEIALTDELKSDFIDYMVNLDGSITSRKTIKSYGSVTVRIFSKYKVLNKDTTKEMLKRWGKKTKIRAVLAKLNEYFAYNNIDYIIRLPKSSRTPRKIPDILSRQELTKVLDTCQKEERLIISCIFNFGAGLRISELINLRWEDIDWDNWSLENKTITAKIKESKGGKSRIVPVPDFTIAELYTYCQEIDNLDSEGKPKNGLIFDFGTATYNPKLKILDEEEWKAKYEEMAYDFIRHNVINKRFKHLTNKHITAHSLRHSRATELYEDHSIPLTTIQKWLGHSDISTTMFYLHLSTKEDTKLMETAGGV